jgi:hypothetical protein
MESNNIDPRIQLLPLQLKEVSHENLNLFVGACIDPPNTCILSNYCSRGSLHDILENDDIKLDRSFKISLIMDLANVSFPYQRISATKLVCLAGSELHSRLILGVSWSPEEHQLPGGQSLGVEDFILWSSGV